MHKSKDNFQKSIHILKMFICNVMFIFYNVNITKISELTYCVPSLQTMITLKETEYLNKAKSIAQRRSAIFSLINSYMYIYNYFENIKFYP